MQKETRRTDSEPKEDARVGDFARLAHDLDNLMVVMTSGLNLLEESDDPGQRDILIARMREAVARGGELADHVRTLEAPSDNAWSGARSDAKP